MQTRAAKGLLVLAALAVAVVAFIRFNRVTLPEGPVEIVWDSEVCAHCKMHVGDPRFAAQLQTTEGEVLSFDDPGCLFVYLQSHDVSVHALYFRSHDGDRWLSESEVGFLPTDDSPMGYGIRAVPNGTPEARGIDWAEARALERPHRPQGGS
jgi:hypothetical protein